MTILCLRAGLLTLALWSFAGGAPAVVETEAPAPSAEPTAESPASPPDKAPAEPSKPAAETTAEPTAEPAAEPTAEVAAELAPETRAILPRIGDYHRAALHVDPVEAAIARGDWVAPTPGQVIVNAAGAEVAWLADDGPRGAELSGGYAYAEFDSPTAGVMLLEAAGAAAVCLNGEWVPGDPYGYGWFRLPVEVAEGKNWLVTHLASPSARPRLLRPTAPVALVPEAATLPDVVVGRPEPLALSIPLCNATTSRLAGHRLRVRWADSEPTITPLRPIDALLLTPIVVTLAPPRGELKAGATLALNIEVLPAGSDDTPLAAAELTLKVVSPVEARTDTFVSDIDGSVQAYSVLPATGESADADPTANDPIAFGPDVPTPERGVVVSLHDAGESHDERIAKHSPALDVDILAPNGRGRWGFDWEDWSRADALEALDDYLDRQKARGVAIDRRRVSVVGEGMGGHGALRLATLRPDRFAAVGITDGWLSFFTQGGARVTPSDATSVARLLGRSQLAEDPLRVIENLSGMGVSLLNGGHPNVTASESRFLRERLGEFHDDFTYFDATGRDASDDDAQRRLQSQVTWIASRRAADFADADTIDFATPNPGASATLGWATIVAPREQGAVARVELTRDTKRREITGTTTNVRRLRLSLEAFRDGGEVEVRLDGGRRVRFRPGRNGVVLSLARSPEGVWRATPDDATLAAFFKNPERAGGFKSVFCCRPQLVYGTKGSSEERRWMAAKARYDAHLFLYRGAGLLEVVADSDLRDTLRLDGDVSRSVVLYGVAPANTAWFLLQQEAIFHRSRTARVERGVAWLAERPESGSDLSVVAIRPRPGSPRASIGVIGGTGIVGMRMTTRLRYFWSGVEYPDFLLYGPEAIDSPARPGQAHDVRAAGFFDADWGTDGGGIVWRDLAI